MIQFAAVVCTAALLADGFPCVNQRLIQLDFSSIGADCAGVLDKHRGCANGALTIYSIYPGYWSNKFYLPLCSLDGKGWWPARTRTFLPETAAWDDSKAVCDLRDAPP